MHDYGRLAEVLVKTIQTALGRYETRLQTLEQKAPRDGADGEKGDRGEAGPIGPIGPQGEAGKDAPPVDVDALALKAAELIQPPKGEKGDPGEPGPPGKDAPPVDVEEIVERVKMLMPTPKDGERGERGEPGVGLAGKDGASCWTGIGAPSFDGKAGDSYVDVKTGEVYQWRGN